MSLTSNFPIYPPGLIDTLTTRRIPILPTDALPSTHSNSLFSGIDYTGFVANTGLGVYGYAMWTGRFAIIKTIPYGYKLQYITVNTYLNNNHSNQTFPAISRVVTAYKMNMIPNVAPVVLTPSGDGASSNISHTNTSITISSTPTFSESEYLLINVFMTTNYDTFSGGYLTITKA
eukprot:SAG11_NODE_10816_length_803_cov_5.139205_2_plen_175_part_00